MHVKDPSRLDTRLRLAIVFCLSLCVHATILLALSWLSIGARQIAPHDHNRPLTVTLPGAAPVPAPEKNPEENIAGRSVMQHSGSTGAAADKAGNKFALSEDGLPLVADQHYFAPDELDEHPFVIQDIPGDPPELREHPQGGTLVLRLWISKEGKVVNAEAVLSELPQAFIDSARARFLEARFAPGFKRGVAVDSVMDVVLHYAPRKPGAK